MLTYTSKSILRSLVDPGTNHRDQDAAAKLIERLDPSSVQKIENRDVSGGGTSVQQFPKATGIPGLYLASISERDITAAKKYGPVYEELLRFEVPTPIVQSLTERNMAVQASRPGVGSAQY